MLHMINPVISINGDSLHVREKSYLCGSASVQKTLAKLAAVSRKSHFCEECSQCVGATLRSEGACQRHPGGWHFGLIEARAPALKAKREPQTPLRFPVGSMRFTPAGFSGATCHHLRKTEDHVTIELPRRPRLTPEVIRGYKAPPKCLGYASVDGTALLRPVTWGTQLNQSRSGAVPWLKGCSAGNGGRSIVDRLSWVSPGKLARRFKPHSARRVPLHSPTRPKLSNSRTTLGSHLCGRMSNRK